MSFKLPDDLYEFQKQDVHRLLSDGQSFLNLSEMGSGKSPVALGVSQLGGFKKTLIVCPNSLRLEWARQIEDWCGIKPQVSKQHPVYDRLLPLFEDMLYGKERNPFFIVNYETFRVRRHLDILNKFPFDLIILDEGHRIRNQQTKQTKGIYEFILKNHSDSKVLILTGSPIVNNPADLFTLLCLVKPDEFKPNSRMSFIDKWCYYWRGRYGIKIYGTRDLEGLRQRTDPFTIRHTKQEVLKDLPEKYYRRVLLTMEGEQRKVYEGMINQLFVLLNTGEQLWAPSVLAQLTRLRQINLEPKILGVDAPSSKTNFLEELLEDYGDRKLVVFSCFEKYIDFLDKHFYNIPHVTITGQIPVDDRMKAVNTFQNDDRIKLVLGTVQSMGEGITLTAASDVVLMDRWWNPTANEQAVDRLHRIGQKSAVQVILPINEESIDQSLDRTLSLKEGLSSAYLADREVIRQVVDDLRQRR